jgi:iron complex outermembrane recepter protein
MKNLRKVWLLSAGAVVCTASPVMAQSAERPAEADQAQIADIVVTAQRRTEKLQDVPIAATVFQPESLVKHGIYGVQALESIAPSLTITPPGNGDALIQIRGVGNLTTSPTSSAGVAFYTDGVFLPAQRFAGDLLYDVQSVEVLRGPQGTLVGENSTGGAILIRSAQPSTAGISGNFRQTFGSYGAIRTEGAINLPLSSTLAFRAAFVIDRRDSYSRNLGTGQANALARSNDELGNLNNQGIRLQLLWRPSDRFDATLRFEAYTENNGGPAIKPAGNAASDPFSASLRDPYEIAYDAPQYFRMKAIRTSLEMNYKVASDITLRSISSYLAPNVVDAADLDYGRDKADVRLTRWYPIRVYTQELNLISGSNKPFQWVVGGFYLKVPRQRLELTAAQAFVPGTPSQPFLNIDTNTVRESKAVFGQASYKFADQFTITLGGRYSENNQQFSGTFSPLTPGGFINIPLVNAAKFTKTTYRAVAEYQPTKDINVYASYSTGVKAGGANLIAAAGSFAPETNGVFEVGLKATMLDRHVRLNAAVFTQDYKNLQVQGVFGGLPITVNAAKAKIDGFEAESIISFGGFTFDGSVSYLNARTTEAFTIPTGPVPAGTRLPYTSKWQGNAAIEYRIGLGEGSLTPRLQYIYLAPRTTQLISGPFTQLDKRSTLDLRLTYDSGKTWQLEGFVTNVTDQNAIMNIAAPAFGSPAYGLTYSAPREFGGRFTFKF